MAKININGSMYEGSSINIINEKIYIDGNLIGDGNTKVINIKVEGDVDRLKIDSCRTLEIMGSVKHVSSISGDVVVATTIEGNVSTVSGDVVAETIRGTVVTETGDVNCKNSYGTIKM